MGALKSILKWIWKKLTDRELWQKMINGPFHEACNKVFVEWLFLGVMLFVGYMFLINLLGQPADFWIGYIPPQYLEIMKGALPTVLMVLFLCNLGKEYLAYKRIWDKVDREAKERDLPIRHRLRRYSDRIAFWETERRIADKEMELYKALSPIPIVVLLLGFILDTEKIENLDWRVYIASVVLVVVVYFYGLRRALRKSRRLERVLRECKADKRHLLEEIEDAAIKNTL